MRKRQERASQLVSCRKGRAKGAVMMVWMFFANLFDPAKVAATEQLMADRRRDSSPARRASGAPPEARP